MHGIILKCNFFVENKANISLLNINNPEIQIKLFEAAQKWLRLGVDGIHFADYGFAGKVRFLYNPYCLSKFIL